MFKPKMIENEKDLCCSKGHMKPVVTISLDPKLQRTQRLLCIECLENTEIDSKFVGFKKIISQIEENQVKKMERVQNVIENQQQLIYSLHSQFDQMKTQVITQLNEIIDIIMEWNQNLQQQGSYYSQYSFYEELETIFFKQNNTDDNSQIVNNNIYQTNLCSLSKLNPKLQQFYQFEEYNKCKELLQSLEIATLNFIQNKEYEQIYIQDKNLELNQANRKLDIEQSQMIQSNYSTNLKPFNYKIIQESSISQSDFCFAIAINNDCSTLLAGCYSVIKVFEFNQGNIKQIQTLNEHKNWVFTLNFMKKSKQFISGSCDKSIIIWKYNQNNLWSSQQILNEHSNQINCLVINNNEDLIISGSSDKTIKFWMKKNEWLFQQTITDHQEAVRGVGLNQQQNRIVSCGHDQFILIIEQQGQNTEWKVVQKISVEQIGWRVCFIDNDVFSLSRYNKEQISIFEMNTKNKEFTKTRDITVKCGSDGNCLFPQKYINSKSILLSKNGQNINLIRKRQNGEFITEQSIDFQTYILFGGMSDDGEYLITWDNKSKQIQVRKYKEI